MNKTKVKIKKPVYLGLSMLDISKTIMYEFCYDYIKPKYRGKKQLCYMNTGSFIVHVKTEDVYVDFAKDIETRKRKNEKVI